MIHDIAQNLRGLGIASRSESLDGGHDQTSTELPEKEAALRLRLRSML
jgi:hypothetical protein